MTIVYPLSGDPDSTTDEYWLLTKTLCRLRCSPRHWYQKIGTILHFIGLVPNPNDPCFYIGFFKDPQYLPNTSNSISLLSLGLYADNFVYFSKDPKVEQLFKHLLHQRIDIDIKGFDRVVFGYPLLVAFYRLGRWRTLKQIGLCNQSCQAVFLGFMGPHSYRYPFLLFWGPHQLHCSLYQGRQFSCSALSNRGLSKPNQKYQLACYSYTS